MGKHLLLITHVNIMCVVNTSMPCITCNVLYKLAYMAKVFRRKLWLNNYDSWSCSKFTKILTTKILLVSIYCTYGCSQRGDSPAFIAHDHETYICQYFNLQIFCRIQYVFYTKLLFSNCVSTKTLSYNGFLLVAKIIYNDTEYRESDIFVEIKSSCAKTFL